MRRLLPHLAVGLLALGVAWGLAPCKIWEITNRHAIEGFLGSFATSVSRRYLGSAVAAAPFRIPSRQDQSLAENLLILLGRSLLRANVTLVDALARDLLLKEVELMLPLLSSVGDWRASCTRSLWPTTPADAEWQTDDRPRSDRTPTRNGEAVRHPGH